MTVTRFSKAQRVPDSDDMSTKKSSPSTTNYAAGIFTYKPNDTMDYDEVYIAQNARFDRIGEYKTRNGLHLMTTPIGDGVIYSNWTSAYTMKDTTGITWTIPSSIMVDSIELMVAAKTSDYGVFQVSLLDSDDNVVATSCASGIGTTPTAITVRFKDAPVGTLKIVVGAQRGSKTSYQVGTNNNTLMYKVHSPTRGEVISLFETNIDDVKTLLFVFKTTAGVSTLYRQDSNGTINSIRQLPTGVTKVRFLQTQNKIRYADGQESPRLIDPTSWTDTAISTVDLTTGVDLGIKVSNLMTGTEANIIYFDADTTTQAVWTYPYNYEYAKEADYTTSATLNKYVAGQTTTTTINKSTLTPVSETHLVSALAVNDLVLDDYGTYAIVTSISGSNVTVTADAHAAETIASYDKFDRDFRQNFPAINTGDPITAMFNLGGIIYFLTKKHKYYFYSQAADTWTQDTSPAQHGTFSQESVVCDLNYAYFASEDGVYIFDGSSEESLTKNSIQNTYDAIEGKDSIRVEMFNNRLYVFYSSNGDGHNDSALVYNINLKLWESFDTGLPVGAVIARQTASNRFICGSGRFGALFTYETAESLYADDGAPIAFDIETAYLHFGTPSQLHRVSKWRPEFATTTGDYSVACGYALDFSDEVKYAFSVNLKRNTTILESDYTWDDVANYGVDIVPTVQSTIPKVYGEFRRIQFRYQHHAAFEPVNLKAVTVSIQTQRLR